MRHEEIRSIVDAMLLLDPEAVDRDELGVLVALNARLKSYAAWVDVRCSRRGNELAARGESESGLFVMLTEGNGSGRDASAAGARDRVCGDLPGFETALAAGAVSGEHLDVLARHTRDLTDDERAEVRVHADDLVAAATVDPASLFERTTKQLIADIRARTRPDHDVAELERQRAASRITRWTDRASGLKMTLISLDPLRDTTLHNIVDAHLTRLRQHPDNNNVPFERLRVDAFVAAVTTTTTSGGTAVGVPEVVVHVDAGTLCDGHHADTLCETDDGVTVPVASMQRFCCEAIITAVIIDTDGTITRLAEQRTANRHQRRALAAIYSTCAHPHCNIPFTQCRIHHIIWWTNGGATALPNLLPVCETHHHLVHEGGWNLTITPDRTLTWTRPDGTTWLTHHSPNRQPNRHRKPAA